MKTEKELLIFEQHLYLRQPDMELVTLQVNIYLKMPLQNIQELMKKIQTLILKIFLKN